MQVSSGEVLADAMMALLPGLDANDERKTCAVFRFYTIVLSSIPGLAVSVSPSPAKVKIAQIPKLPQDDMSSIF